MAANFVLLSLVQVLTALAFALFYGVDFTSSIWELSLTIALATLGICSVGTLLAAMAVRTRLREVLLPILLLPALVPILAGAVRATLSVMAGQDLPFSAIQLLIVIDGIYLVVSFLGFDYILDE